MTANRESLLTPAAPIDLATSVILLGIGAAAFGPVFDGRSGYVAAGGGALLGLLVGAGAAWFGLRVLSTTAVLLITYVVIGGALALPDTSMGRIVPTLATVHRLTLLTVQAWRDLLTISTPVSEFTGPAVVPLLSGLVCAVLAISIMLRAKQVVWALVPFAAFFTVGILWGLPEAPHGPAYGVVFAVVALGWAAFRSERRRAEVSAQLLDEEGPRNVLSRARAASALALLVVAGVVGALAAPDVAASAQRNVLREHVIPPLDLQNYASPLTMYRYLERDEKDQVLMTVSGLPKGSRIRLATLDTYDGIIYGVGTSASFRRIGKRVASPHDPNEQLAALKVAIGVYAGHWVPGGGDLHALSLAGSGHFKSSVYYSSASGTVLATDQLTPGTTYTEDVGLPVQPASAEMATAALAGPADPDVTNVPDVLSQVASDMTGDAKDPYGQLKAIEQTLKTHGFYSDGSDGQSRPGHTAERLTTMFQKTQFVGDDEQYAVGMALMATKLGMPARVVMGFYPDPDKAAGSSIKITGSDAHVWVEVDFRGVGWVSFDPTPPRDHRTRITLPQPQNKPRPQVLPPPQVLKPPSVPEPTVQNGRQVTVKKHHGSRVGDIVWIALAAVGGTTLLAFPFVAVLLLKRRRRIRRRTAPLPVDSASGSWAEVVDAATDLGVVLPRVATRRESACQLDEAFPNTTMHAVAERIDAGVFGAVEPTDAELAHLWDEVSDLLGRMRGSVSPPRRLWAALSPRSLSPTRRVRNQ